MHCFLPLNWIHTIMILIYLVGYEGKEGWCAISWLALRFGYAWSNKYSSTMAHQYAGMSVNVLIRTNGYAHVHNQVVRKLVHKRKILFVNNFQRFLSYLGRSKVYLGDFLSAIKDKLKLRNNNKKNILWMNYIFSHFEFEFYVPLRLQLKDQFFLLFSAIWSTALISKYEDFRPKCPDSPWGLFWVSDRWLG